MTWCCVYTKYGCEVQAAGSLENDQGFKTYLPRLRTFSEERGTKPQAPKCEFMFPRYVLVQLTCLSEASCHEAAHARGVDHLLGAPVRDPKTNHVVGFSPLTIQDSQMEALITRCGGDRAELIQLRGEGFRATPVVREKKHFELDDEVIVINGAFASWVGTVKEVLGRDKRIIILLSLFEKETRVTLHTSQAALRRRAG